MPHDRHTAHENSFALHVDSLTAGYGEDIILRDVSFAVRYGEIVTVLGGSGCGKSTLLRHLTGLRQPHAGRIFIAGQELTGASDQEHRALMQSFGVTYQSGALFGSMTLLENVMLPLEEFSELPEEARTFIARMKLSLVGLAGYENYIPAALSGGMQKRAAVARAMALDPFLLFLDEPSAGLDPITSAGLDELILGLRDSLGMTCVLVTHELSSIFCIADRAIMLDKTARGIIAQGSPEELKNTSQDSRVRQFFNRKA